MKKVLLLAAALCAFLLLPSPASLAEEETEPDAAITDGVDAWIDKLDLSFWEETLAALPDEVRALFPEQSAEGLLRFFVFPEADGISGDFPHRILKLFFGQVRHAGGRTALLLALSVFSGFLAALAPEGGAGEAALLILRCLAFTAVMGLFLSAVDTGSNAALVLGSFMELALPVLVTLVSAVGGTASALLMQSALGSLISGIAVFFRGTVLPLSVLSGTLAMIDGLSGKKRIAEMAKLSGKLAKWLIGAASTLFLGVTAIRNITAATFDGVSIRTAKYAASSLVPIAGGLVSGTMDTVLGCAVLVKTSAGAALMLLLLALLLTPVLELAATVLALRLSAAAAQPIADEKLIKMYLSAADGMELVMAALIVVGIASILLVGMLMKTGGVGAWT